MFFAITTHLKPGSTAARADATAAHRAYLARHGAQILAVGPTIGEDGTTPVGSLYLIDLASRTDAERFVAKDPMTAAGVRASVEIVEWRMAGFDRVYPLQATK